MPLTAVAPRAGAGAAMTAAAPAARAVPRLPSGLSEGAAAAGHPEGRARSPRTRRSIDRLWPLPSFRGWQHHLCSSSRTSHISRATIDGRRRVAPRTLP